MKVNGGNHMLFFMNENYHFAIRLKEEKDAEEMEKSFASGHQVREALNEGDLITKMLKYMRFNRADRLYLFILNDSNGMPLFAHIGENTPLTCNHLKNYFNMGIITELKKPSNLNINKKIQFPTSSTFEKKFQSVPFSVRTYVAKFLAEPVESAKPLESAKEESEVLIKDTEVIIESANFNTSYLNDNVFMDAVKGAQMLRDNYQKAVSQKPELLEFVKNCDKETLDILHDLELEYKWYDVITAYKTILKITHIRRQRRKAKDKIEVITALEEGLSLECAKEVADLPNRLQNRQYRKRNNSGMFDYEKIFKKGK
jgi:hypothetical protein